MHVRLVMNPGAGKGGHEEHELEQEITAAGHFVSRLRPGDLQAGQGDLIAVAGGDGTVAQAVLEFRGAGMPLTVIPLGTANNIARSLGINGYPDILKRRVEDKPPGARAHLSLVRLKGAGSERLLLEAIGVGLLARLMRAGPPEQTVPEPSMRDRRQILREQAGNMAELLRDHPPGDYGLWIDGRDYSGAYLMVEVMNIAFAGPGLRLAPGKDPGDGELEVVLVRPNERRLLENYLAACMQGGEPENLFARLRGRTVELRCRPSDLHAGDELPEGAREERFTIQAAGRVVILT